eukprot:366931-Pyramimonas_sp.AAC.2
MASAPRARSLWLTRGGAIWSRVVLAGSTSDILVEVDDHEGRRSASYWAGATRPGREMEIWPR